MQMFETTAALIGVVLAVAACALALWRGRWPERGAAVVILTGWLISAGVQSSQHLDPEWGLFWVDLVVLAIFICLLARSGRVWLAVAGAFQLLAVGSHLAMLIDHRVTMNTYLMALSIWSLAILAALLVGALTARPFRRVSRDDAPLPPVRRAGRPDRHDGPR
jgi:hypothetical protein